ncbi:hypothetical protein OG946_21405 [Streptomyces sp. NBC_01808]|uniref:hypothetical protein n=1 Tax=Streptomyces sp. NBC_01808 TaxID=2975947 RepID=UPI002DDA601A|nr:hypothetical protein [Streptomyces sp. NBC_01808]WSA39696.1 hypothetical protein OG946_21405 [Streptomyces sp. NBC_01808]
MATRQWEFQDLRDRYPVMAQALDNQWLPPSAAASRQAATAGAGPDDAHLAAASAELRRALVNSGTLVANRAYFLNNPALYENFAAGAAAEERRAFARLLNDGSLVPFLLGERDPAERPAYLDRERVHRFSIDDRIHRSWQRLLEEEAEPACVRLSWDDEANRVAARRIGEYFGRNVITLNRLDPVLLAEDLGIPVEQADAMRRGILTDIARWSVEQDPDTAITRNAVYENFFTRPGTRPHERLLRDGDHILTAKQLVDLLYNIGVPVAADVVAATPPQSPPRSALQELTAAAADPVADPEALGRLLRGVFADALHRAVDGPDSYGSLSLAEIVALRQEEEWRAYIDALSGFVNSGFTPDLLPSPHDFAAATAQIARLHAQMLRRARKISRGPGAFRREMSVMLILESPGVVLRVLAGEASLLSGSLDAVSVVAGPLVMRLVFKEARASRGGLGHSITLPALRLRSLRKDWETILRAYGQETRPARGDSAASEADQQVTAT